MVNFWQKLKKPFFVLAPMDDVTDTVFRSMVKKYSNPDVLMTEFVSCDGVTSEGFKRLVPKLKFTQKQRPIVAQIWGIKPENFLKTARMLVEMGFDGIDINMGCPDKQVTKKGGGASCINNPSFAKEIFLATKEGAVNLPVSIKTRIGYREIQTEEWLGFLLKLKPDVLTVHGRTVSEMSKFPVHWDEIGKVVKMRDQMNSKTLVVGNGDIKSYQEGLEKVKFYQVDGIMIGRGVLENLWIFDPQVNPGQITPQKRLRVLLEHIRLFDKTWGHHKNFHVMRKYFKIYVRDFEGAVDLRAQLMEAENSAEASRLITNF